MHQVVSDSSRSDLERARLIQPPVIIPALKSSRFRHPLRFCQKPDNAKDNRVGSGVSDVPNCPQARLRLILLLSVDYRFW